MKHLMFALALALVAFSPHSPVILESDAASPVTVNAGEDFMIALQSNPSTGYAWNQTVSDGKILAYEGAVRQNPSTTMPGAPGQQLFFFHATRTGMSIITFTYARFETNAAAAKTVTFTITVR